MNATGHAMDAGCEWADLETKGYVIVRSFLRQQDIELLKADFASQQASGSDRVRREIVMGSRGEVRSRIIDVLLAVRDHSRIKADVIIWADYVSTETSNLPWHQDFETDFFTQDPYNALNFYIPIIKPERERSNLRIVPFDRLARDVRERLARSGARRFHPRDAATDVTDDSGEVRRTYRLPVDIENEAAVTPELGVGDLLLLRGDILHRTQDADTKRISASFRAGNSHAIIQRSRLARGTVRKLKIMAWHWGRYQPMFRCFDAIERNEATLAELLPYVGEAEGEGRPPMSFQIRLWAEKLRALVRR
jgi:hypothetical protein